MKNFTILICMLLLAPLFVSAQHPAQQTVKDFVTAINNSNAEAMGATLTDDMRLYYANGGEDHPKHNIVDHWGLFLFEQGDEKLTIQTVELLPLNSEYAFWVGQGKEKWVEHSSFSGNGRRFGILRDY